jgi:predicted TIM-barrel fold metal-dependent hydrolase
VVAGDLREVMEQTEHALADGARAVFIRDGSTIEGHSPASPHMDPFWAMLADAGACGLLHVGGSDSFVGNDWKVTPALDVDPAGGSLADRLAGPHNIATMHLSPSNYVACLVFGGVFDRHPGLRFGVIEYGAMWAAPLLELLVNRAEQSARVSSLQRSPMEVFRENLRFTPFSFEPMSGQIERYGMPEIYAFSTDFPHPEGGTNPHELHHDDLAHLGPGMIERYFRTNAELLLPI